MLLIYHGLSQLDHLIVSMRTCVSTQIVAENRGVEEYVHLKSKDDEYHHMESTMPRRGEEDAEGGEGQAREEGQGPAAAGGDAGDGDGDGDRDGEQAALEEEYAEAYRLYQQKLAEETEGGRHPDDPAPDFGESERFREGGVHAHVPSPRPPPFSDDTAQGVAYGFEGGDERSRAADAFAFTEEMEHLDQGSPPPVFGERVDMDEEEMGAQQQHSTSQHQDAKDYLFARDPAGPDRAGGVRPFQASLHPLSTEGEQGTGAMNRCTSYESLHEID